MDSQVFQKIFNWWGQLQVDLFAARHNAQLPQHFSFKQWRSQNSKDAWAQHGHTAHIEQTTPLSGCGLRDYRAHPFFARSAEA